MKSSQSIIIPAMVVIAFVLLSCAPPGLGQARSGSASGEPTMTAIPLPTRTPTEVAKVTAAASPTVPLPTATPSPKAAGTAMPEPTPTATETPLPPTPTAEPIVTARPQPTRARPQPTTTSEFRGKLVFQTSIGGDICTVRADGTNLQHITDGIEPMWSPDGTQVAFTRWRDPRGVWVMNADGSGERRVFDWSEARWPSWSPDGRQILFSRQHGGQLEETERCFRGRCVTIPPRPHWRLGIVGPGDGTFFDSPGPEVALAPDWSPDGNLVVYDGEQGLVIQSVDGEISYHLTEDARDTVPTWSPDGNQVAFVRYQHDHWEIYVVDADGQNLMRLTDTPTYADGTPRNSVSPAWSPDGQYIAFLTDRTGPWEIWAMKADGSGPKPMFGLAPDGLTLAHSLGSERAISWTW